MGISSFKQASDYRKSFVINSLETNLKMWLDWCFLGIGAWVDIDVDQTGIHGGGFSALKPVIDEPGLIDGQIWQGFRKDWVWETGVDFNSYSPNNVTGVRVDGVWQSSGYYVNYENGWIVFDTAVDTGSTVNTSYAHRAVQILRADTAPWWREIQFDTFDTSDAHFTQTNFYGDWSIGSYDRVQLPTVIVEAVPQAYSRGYELGNNSILRYQSILFHVLSDSRNDRNKLVDILLNQVDETVYLFNVDDIVASGDLPLDYRGALTGTKMYPDLIDESENGGYRWFKARFMNTEANEIITKNPKLYTGTVKTTMEILIQ
jgi:hypothetical protein